MDLRDLLAPTGLMLAVSLVAGCVTDSASNDDHSQTGDDQEITVDRTVPIKVNQTFTKTISFSKDFGSGDASFAATAIVTARAHVAIDTNVSVHAKTFLFQLRSFSGQLDGTWTADADVDVRVQLTGKAAKDVDFVRRFDGQAQKHLLDGKESLFFLKIPTGVDMGIAKLNAGFEVQLACELDATSNFEATASTGVDGPLGIGFEWDRKTVRGKVGDLDHHWSFSTKNVQPKFHPPAFTVSEGEAQFHARCGLQPSVNLEIDGGVGDLANAALGAKLVGEAYATADGQVDAVQRAWAADYDVGVRAGFEVFATASVLGHGVEKTEMVPILGGPDAPLHLGQKHLQGTLPL